MLSPLNLNLTGGHKRERYNNKVLLQKFFLFFIYFSVRRVCIEREALNQDQSSLMVIPPFSVVALKKFKKKHHTSEFDGSVIGSTSEFF